MRTFTLATLLVCLAATSAHCAELAPHESVPDMAAVRLEVLEVKAQEVTVAAVCALTPNPYSFSFEYQEEAAGSAWKTIAAIPRPDPRGGYWYTRILDLKPGTRYRYRFVVEMNDGRPNQTSGGSTFVTLAEGPGLRASEGRDPDWAVSILRFTTAEMNRVTARGQELMKGLLDRQSLQYLEFEDQYNAVILAGTAIEKALFGFQIASGSPTGETAQAYYAMRRAWLLTQDTMQRLHRRLLAPQTGGNG